MWTPSEYGIHSHNSNNLLSVILRIFDFFTKTWVEMTINPIFAKIRPKFFGRQEIDSGQGVN